MKLIDRSVHWANRAAKRFLLQYPTTPVHGQLVYRNGAQTTSFFNGQVLDGWNHDPLLKRVFMSPGYPVSLPELFGQTSYPPVISTLLGDKPIEGPRDPNGDFRRYGNALSGLLRLGRTAHPPDSFAREHFVYHASLGGTARSEGHPDDLVSPGVSSSSPIGQLLAVRHLGNRDGVVYRVHPATGSIRFEPTGSFTSSSLGTDYVRFSDFWSVAQKYSTPSNESPYGTVGASRYSYKDFEWTETLGDDSLVFTTNYTLIVLFITPYGGLKTLGRREYRVSFVSKTTYNRAVRRNSGQLTLNGSYQVPPDCISVEAKATYTLVNREDYWTLQSGNPTFLVDSGATIGTTVNYGVDLLDKSFDLLARSKNFSTVLVDRSGRRRLDKVKGFVEDNLNDILATSLYSSAAAAQKIDSSSNFLEALPQLPQLISAGSPIVNSVRDLVAIAKGDVGRIGRLCNDVAESYLSYVYGIAPAPSDVDSLSRILRDGISVDMGKLHSMRGSFAFTFPRDVVPGDGTLTLLTRSKIVVDGLSGPIATWLQLGKAGVQPSLKNLWDLVPFSFVADWFVNLSERFSDIDSSIVLAALTPAYFVHSYKVRYLLSSDEKREARISVDSDPWFQIFQRDVSCWSPVPRKTNIDFRAPKSLDSRLVPASALLLVTGK